MEGDIQCYARLLQSCNSRNHETLGRQIHNLFLKKGVLSSVVAVANRLLQMYSRCGRISDARKLFDEMPRRNCFSWNTMIEGYMKSGDKESSLRLFDLMPERNHFSWNVVVSGFAKAGELGIARKVFNDMPRRDAATWNSLLHGYVRNGYPKEALSLFKELRSSADVFILATVVGACAELCALKCGKQIHARILIDGIDYDMVMQNAGKWMLLEAFSMRRGTDASFHGIR